MISADEAKILAVIKDTSAKRALISYIAEMIGLSGVRGRRYVHHVCRYLFSRGYLTKVSPVMYELRAEGEKALQEYESTIQPVAIPRRLG